MIWKNETIPYVRIDQIVNFIKRIPTEKAEIKELGDKFGRSSIQNMLPTLQLLGLCKYDRKNAIIDLTDVGEKFRSLLITNDEKRAAEIIKPNVDKSEALSFVKGLLERKGGLSILDIGREISFKFNKKWNNVLTYKTYGAACASILGFVGYGTYSRGLLRKQKLEVTRTEISPPYAGFEKIIKIVGTVFTHVEVDLHTLSQELKTKKGRLNVEIKNCVDLGFLERPALGMVAITSIGKNFVDPLKKGMISEMFREALLRSNYSKIIFSLSENPFDAEELGKILKHQMEAKWFHDKTILTFGKKFLNWLNSAKLLEKTEKGKYKLISDLIKKVEKPSSEKILSITDYYTLGKNIGTLLSSSEFDKTKLAAEELLEFCKEDKSLATVTELLQEHYKLFLELKDNRIFSADIKIIEKILGLEEVTKKEA